MFGEAHSRPVEWLKWLIITTSLLVTTWRLFGPNAEGHDSDQPDIGSILSEYSEELAGD